MPAMARPRIIPDSTVHAAVLRILEDEGERAVSFAAVARATGLAGATLVQRFGSRDAMVTAALHGGWDRLDAALETAEAEAEGAPGLLRRLPADPRLALASRHDAGLRERAAAWRARVEGALARRLRKGRGGGRADGAGARAAMLFALWQGGALWGSEVSVKEASKRLR